MKIGVSRLATPNTILNVNIHFAPAHEQWTISLDMALILNEIWRARNHILFQDGKADLLKIKQSVHAKFSEFSKVFSPVIHPSPEESIAAWSPPPEDWIKINVDAALNDTRSALAVAARDNHGEVIRIWGTRHHL
ncbi:hypothetical protein SO802_005508 [Lithocarpus litseifolius]|uniref:Uncharacterized protein n=1 Tax=Lithocarpus litseifolius TaxID=425828 RepID=A0AAW2DM58_9ROSI